ncbi:hypothetical protein GJAV_G00084950 [Gymnothorax javanicus]|nr:hypothetical protein GJAV_G00084950 [Gymnothorax javanicus]
MFYPQKQLGATQSKFQQRIQEREKELQDLRQAVQSLKLSAQTAVEDSERIFTELIRSIERRRSEVKELIRDQEKAEVSWSEGLLDRLEQEIAELRRRDAELEQFSHTEDHIHFLQTLMNEKIVIIEKRVEKNENTTERCMARVIDLEGYGRRWNLRLHGLPESEKENVHAAVIDVCRQVLPSEKEKLPGAVDIAHRVGRQRDGDPKPRSVIIRFISRRHREEVWKAAKNCAFLRSKGLRFTEDLTMEDRENRQKLWPMIKKAREEGKMAYFVGGRGFVNGSEIRP